MSQMSRRQYTDLFGPTVGDKIRPGDTELYVEIEKDLRVYGDEAVYGGGKTLRDGMGMDNQLTSAAGALDLVITNVTIVDAIAGVIKADVGVKDGKIDGIGKAGNPGTMQGVTAGLAVGPATDAISGEHCILTAAGIDSHVHYISPQQAYAALSNGVTTFWGGGIGPTDGTNGTTITSGPWNLAMMPAAIRAALTVADEYDVQVSLHSDTLNEAGFVEDTIAAFDGRTIHTFHTEGAGGGHAPDLLKVAGEHNVLPSSTNPTLPYGINSQAELFDMIMVCHNLNPRIQSDVSFAESRVRAETIAAENVMHDMGTISMFSSDSQAMGRVGENWLRAIQTADAMKKARGKLPEDTPNNDNFRVLRFVAKVTINPAITQGIAHVLVSIEVGKMADLVLWEPAFFGAKPKLVIKGGLINWSLMGDNNASLPTPQPVIYRPMFGAFGSAMPETCITFVSRAAFDAGIAERLALRRKVMPVVGTRTLTKRHMVRNGNTPKIDVDPETFAVQVDGVHATVAPAKSLALNQLHFFT